MKMYVYDPDTMTVAAIVNGESNSECERKAADAGYGDTEAWSYTYSPAFGMADGLIESSAAVEVE